MTTEIGGRKKRPQYVNRSEVNEHLHVVHTLVNENYEIFDQELPLPISLPNRPGFCIETRHRKRSFLKAVRSGRLIPILHPNSQKSGAKDQYLYLYGEAEKKYSGEVIFRVTIIQLQPTNVGRARLHKTWSLFQMPVSGKQPKNATKLMYGTRWLTQSREDCKFDWRRSGAILVLTVNDTLRGTAHSLVIAFDQDEKIKKKVRKHHANANLLCCLLLLFLLLLALLFCVN